MTLLNRLLLWSFFLLSFTILVGGDFWHNIFRTDHYKAPHFAIPEFVNAELGLEDVNGTVVCFGDFNSDTFTDAFVLSPDGATITPYIWLESSFRFVIAPSGAVVRRGVVAVSAADFNYDGRLDLLVQARNVTASPATVSLHVYLGNAEADTLVELASGAVASATSPVLVLEADGDLRPDLFGTDATSGLRGFWLNKETGWTFQPQTNSEGNGAPLPPLVTPQQSAFVDVDGDCRADLVTVSCSEGSASACAKSTLEVWLNGLPTAAGAAVFVQLSDRFALPQGVKQISFADFDADGASDLLMAVCPSADCVDAYVAIAYAQMKPLCDSFIPLASAACRSLSALCMADDEWTFPGLATLQPSAYYVVVTSNDTHAPLSLTGDTTVRIGDYDMDGFADLVLPLASGLQLWRSKACDGQSCNGDAVSAGRRTFAPDITSAAVRSAQDVVSAAFIDLGEKGSLDLVLVTKPAVGSARPLVLYNNLVIDAFFMKTLGLNGKCAAWCDSGPRFPPKPYGGVQVGGTFIFSTTRSTGVRHLVHATALSQVGVVSLQTPYVYFGLGRTNNYVEMLYYGMPLRQGTNHHYWTPIMPNAQVYVVPYPSDKPAEWSIDSFISPADYAGWVFVAFAVALLINGAVVWFFRSREIREDENEKKASAHLFSFDIL